MQLDLGSSACCSSLLTSCTGSFLLPEAAACSATREKRTQVFCLFVVLVSSPPRRSRKFLASVQLLLLRPSCISRVKEMGLCPLRRPFLSVSSSGDQAGLVTATVPAMHKASSKGRDGGQCSGLVVQASSCSACIPYGCWKLHWESLSLCVTLSLKEEVLFHQQNA